MIFTTFSTKNVTPRQIHYLSTVLTISGTASEVDNYSVISNPDTQEKLEVMFPSSPIYSTVNPSIQLSLPWRQVMCGAVDALCHLLKEMFQTDAKSTPTLLINFALHKSILRSMEKIMADPLDLSACGNFCRAASLALSG